MNIVDVVVLVWLVATTFRGFRVGLIRQVASFGGFLIGLFGGGWVLSRFFGSFEGDSQSMLIALLALLIFASLAAALAEMVATRLERVITFSFARAIDAGLGAVFGVTAAVVLGWLMVSAINRLPLADIGLSVSESRAYQMMERVLPSAPNIAGQINQIAGTYGFPQIFVDGEPDAESVSEPVAAEVEAAAEAARQSVVRVEGAACGRISSGSGFIASPGFVVTNAHVVAGVGTPVVVRGSEKHRAVPVWFNDALDFAVLRVEGMNGPALSFAKSVPERGQSGAILGHPGGGDLTVVSGVMQGQYEAVGRDIYGQDLATRRIYRVQAVIQQGSSGGPFVLPDGSVAGVMFGASPSQPDTSYAIASTEAASELSRATASGGPVSTGACL